MGPEPQQAGLEDDRHDGEAAFLKESSSLRDALAIAQRELGPSHPDTLRHMSELASRGRKFILAKRLVEQRRRGRKGPRNTGAWQEQPVSSNSLIRTYREDVDRKRLLIRKANTTRDKLIFIVEAIRKLLADENFVTLLRAESLNTLPSNLGERIQAWRQA